MQYDVETPAAYLDALADDWRKEKLLAVRETMRAAVPGLAEGIAYKMLEYRLNGEVFAHLNAQKAYVGVYLGDLSQLDPEGEIVSALDAGKSCVRLKKRNDPADLAPLFERKREVGGGAC